LVKPVARRRQIFQSIELRDVDGREKPWDKPGHAGADRFDYAVA
jgi:hypothetical protein